MFGPRVAPDELFDRDTGGAPPTDAFDVQFRLPLSLTAWIDRLDLDGRRHELAAVQRWYEELADYVVQQLQRMCGRVGPPDFHGHDTARLALTAVLDPVVVGENGLRPHLHVYLSPRATRVRDGEVLALDRAPLRSRIDGVFEDYKRQYEAQTAELFGLRWGRVETGLVEVVHPPGPAPVGFGDVCTRPWGRRTPIVTDVGYVRASLAVEHRARRQHAAGVQGT